jgi:predicted amidohydrolase YtcJ
MLKQGIAVVGSSDCPCIEKSSPWMGISAAVHRTTDAGEQINPEETISVTQALDLYTRKGAYVNYVEDRLGTLSPGKLADTIVLEENPLEIDPVKLKNIHINMTFVNGKEVYKAS